MKIVTTSYINSTEYKHPDEWLERINFHITVLESLALIDEVISIEQINYEGELTRNGVQYKFLDFRKRKLYFPLKLHRYIKSLHPDVVLVHGLHFPFQIIQLRRTLGNSVLLIVQNHAEKPFTGWRKWLQKKADRHIDHYLFASREFALQWVDKGIIRNEERITEVMEASSVFSQTDRIEAKRLTRVSGEPVFLWVGRLDRNKDPLTVVNAFIAFIEHNPSAKLYMIFQQDGLLPDIKKLIQASATANIVLVGKVPHKQLEPWFNSADFIISGSHYEGSGIAVAEAMSCGCIPMLTNILSFRSMTNGHCGYLYEPGNSQQLSALLVNTSNINIEEERAKTLAQFERDLSPAAIAKKIAAVIAANKV